MADLVHGGDTYTHIHLAPKTASNDSPTYPGEWFRVPFAGETMTLVRDASPQLPEISGFGALKILDYGVGHWRGTIKTLVYYNAPWFHILLCQLMGGMEGLVVDTLNNGDTNAVWDANVHWYIPQSYRTKLVGSDSAIPWGLSLTLAKQGPTNTAKYWETIGGGTKAVYITAATFEFPADGWPTVTWELIGPPPEDAFQGSLTPIDVDTGAYAVTPVDNSRSHSVLPSVSESGSTIGTRNWRRISVRIENGLEFPPRYITSPDTEQNIGHVRPVTVTSEWESLLEHDEAAIAGAGKVKFDFIAACSSSWGGNHIRRLRWISAGNNGTPLADPGNNIPYSFEILTKGARVVSYQDPIEGPGGLTARWTESWGTQALGGDGFPDEAGMYDAPVLISLVVGDGDEPATNVNPVGPGEKFSTTDMGGNVPDASL